MSNCKWAKLNCDCDFQAAQVRSCAHGTLQRARSYTLPLGHVATLQLGELYVTTQLPMAIQHALYQVEMEEYIIQKAVCKTKSTYDMVDWDSRNQASLKL